MAEFETRKDDERCFSCKFCGPALKGQSEFFWCQKKPRLHQKHEDRVHRFDWCQYYERSTEYMATEMKTEVEESLKAANPLVSVDAAEELNLMSAELTALISELERKLVKAVMEGDSLRLHETKGMLLALSMVHDGLAKRMVALGVPNDGEAK